MPSDLALRLVAAVLAVGAVGGATWAAFELVPSATIEARGVGLASFEATVTATPGHTVAFPLNVTNLLGAPRTVTVTLADAGGAKVASRALDLALPAKGARAAWFPLDVAADATPGTHRLTFSAATDASGVSLYTTHANLVVLGANAPGEKVVREGSAVQVRYAATFANGSAYFGNLPYSGYPAFPLVTRFSPTDAPHQFQVGAVNEPQPGMNAHLVGMREGEWRTVEVARAFGNTSVEQPFDRRTVFELEFDVEPGRTNVTRPEFERWLAQNDLGSLTRYRPGDAVRWYLNTTTGQAFYFPATLTSVGTDKVTLDYPDVGERFTLLTSFRNGSFFKAQGESSWRLRTEPTVPRGEIFSWVSYWPNGTRITDCAPTCDGNFAAATNVTLTHLDATDVGRSFTLRTQGVPQTFTVVNVDASRIYTTTRNLHPYAGIDVVYHLRVEKILT